MGTVIDFPVETAARRRGSTEHVARPDMSGNVVILPAIRIERDVEGSNGNSPDQGTAPSRGRRRRARP